MTTSSKDGESFKGKKGTSSEVSFFSNDQIFSMSESLISPINTAFNGIFESYYIPPVVSKGFHLVTWQRHQKCFIFKCSQWICSSFYLIGITNDDARGTFVCWPAVCFPWIPSCKVKSEIDDSSSELLCYSHYSDSKVYSLSALWLWPQCLVAFHFCAGPYEIATSFFFLEEKHTTTTNHHDVKIWQNWPVNLLSRIIYGLLGLGIVFVFSFFKLLSLVGTLCHFVWPHFHCWRFENWTGASVNSCDPWSQLKWSEGHHLSGHGVVTATHP